MKPIQYQQPQYQDVGGRVPIDPIRLFRGLNGFDPLSIEPVYFTDMQNMGSSDYPAVSTRPGKRLIGQFTGPVLGMTMFDGRVHAIFNDGTWRHNSPFGTQGTWTTVRTGLSTANRYSFASFIGKDNRPNLYILSETEPMKSWDGTTVKSIAGAPTSSKSLVVYQNRLWVIAGKELKACAVDDQNTWDRYNGGAGDSYGKQLEFPNGEYATGLFVTPYSLIIVSETSMLELTGTDPTNFTLRTLTPEVGAYNAGSGVTLAGITYLFGQKGIYQYAGGTLPVREFSEIVQKLAISNTGFAAAGTDGELVYFSQLSSMVLVYDPRAGIESWSKWTGVFPRFYGSFYSGTLRRMAVIAGTLDGEIIAFDADNDFGSPIPWSVTTIPFTNASIASKQRLYKLFISLEYTGSVQIYLSNKITGEDFELIASASGTNAVETRRFIIPVAKYTRENYIRIRISGQGRAKIHEIARNYRQLPVY